MAPIRVGLLGLGKTKDFQAGAWAAITHLPAILASPHLQLVAVANSSVESAEAAIKFHELSPAVKAYGNPVDLANDPEVDLVLCSVTVTKHYQLIKPAILAGKDVFVEWPLGATTAEAEELTALAREKKVRAVVGLQGRADPIFSEIKKIIKSGKIGQVTSSISTGVISHFGEVVPESAIYYVDINSGGNSFTISFGHFLDSCIQVLGDIEDCSTIMENRFPTVQLVDQNGKVLDPAYPKTSPTEIFVHGRYKSGAVFSASVRYLVTKTASGDAIRWIITGTEGEIEIAFEFGMTQMGFPNAKILVRKGDGEVEDVKFDGAAAPDYVAKLPPPAKNVARMWDAFVNGDEGAFATFASAVETHRSLDTIKTAAK